MKPVTRALTVFVKRWVSSSSTEVTFSGFRLPSGGLRRPLVEVLVHARRAERRTAPSA